MSEKHALTRRDFLKKSAVSALGVMAGSLLGGTAVSFAEERGTYIPGTYSAEAKGAQGIVTVTMTFDAESITDVKVDVSQETPSIGGAHGEDLEKELARQAREDLRNEKKAARKQKAEEKKA